MGGFLDLRADRVVEGGWGDGVGGAVGVEIALDAPADDLWLLVWIVYLHSHAKRRN
jgi:hypothetical protein